VAVKKNLIKIILGLIIMEYSVNLFFVVLGYKSGGSNPMPQAIVTVLILTGLSTTIIMTAIAMRLYERFGTFDITKIRKLKG